MRKEKIDMCVYDMCVYAKYMLYKHLNATRIELVS
jgi:hypothetical protein